MFRLDFRPHTANATLTGMRYIVLRDAYEPDRVFPQWDAIGFRASKKTAIALAAKPKKPFHRGDIFVVLETDHVSNIIPNIEKTAIAVSSSRTSSVQGNNWYETYESNSATRIAGRIASFLTMRSAVQLTYAWITQCASESSLDDIHILGALEAIDRWLRLGVPAGESLKDIYGWSKELRGLAYDRLQGRTKDAILNCLAIILTSGGSAAGQKTEIFAVVNSVYESHPMRPGGGRNPEALPRMKEILVQMFPMRYVMLAEAESKLV